MDNSTPPDTLATRPRKPRWRTALPWAMGLTCLLGLLVLQWMGSEIDFSVVNVGSAALVALMWISLVLGLKLSALPRAVWRVACLLPIAAGVGYLVAYKLERFDGELRPRFRPRWSEPAKPLVSKSEDTGIDPGLLEPRDTDYPQFLGPDRNSTLPGPLLSTDWESHPPEILWKIPIGDGWSGFAVQGDVAITMEQRGAREWVTAYGLRDGKLLWHHAMDGKHSDLMGGTGPRSTPTIANGRVYACSAVSRLVCLELATGKEIWAQELLALSESSQAEFESQVSWGRSASPLVWNSLVITTLGGAPSERLRTLIAFDADSGEIRWRAGNQQISYASPSIFEINGTEQLIVIAEQAMFGFDARTQQELWSLSWPGSSSGRASVSQPVQVDENRIFISKGYGQGCRLVELSLDEGQWSATVVWKNLSALRTKFTSSVVYQGHAYGLSDGILECVDLTNGKRKWKRGRYQQGQVLLVGSHLLITSERGEVVLVAATPERFSELAKMQVIGDVTWNPAALSGDRLLVRNSDEAACVKLPIETASPSSAAAVHSVESRDGE